MQTRFRQASVIAGFGALCAALLFAGCSDSSSARSVLRVESLNNNAALQSDVLSPGPTVVEDAVTLTVRNEPHDDVLVIDPNGPFGHVTIERYEIRFESDEAVPSVRAALGWTVPSGRSVSGSIVIVPAELKLEPPLVSLVNGGEIVSTAHITLIGREATSNREVRIEAILPVHFANWSG